ncbi:MAG: 4Fe-4S single cluster domain-containing protein [Nocardioidaceae bacterium]
MLTRSDLEAKQPLAPVAGHRVAIARIVERTLAEGPGQRTAVWVQGCSIQCPGCFNPHLWNGRGGESFAVADLVALILATGTEGVTFLGGEPFDQAAPLAAVAEGLQAAGQSVMTFTGYTLETLRRVAGQREDVAELLARTDLLADGPFLRDQLDDTRPWIGSTNQGLHFLSDRLAWAERLADQTGDTLEVRVRADGQVAVNGWASSAALESLLDGLGSRPSPSSTG